MASKINVDKIARNSGTPEFTIPTADGAANTILQTDGSGVLSFTPNVINSSNVTYTGNSVLDIKNAGVASSVKLYCETGNAHYTEIKSGPHASATSYTLTLPNAPPASNGLALTATTAGVASWAAAGGGKVLQVLQATKTDTQTTTTNAWVDVTGLSIAITPEATTSKILVSAMVQCVGTVGAAGAWTNIVRDSTEIAIATGVGSRWAASAFGYAPDAGDTRHHSTVWLDSPSTSSATSYKVQFTANGSNTAYINRTAADGNNAAYARGVSSITVMEIGV